MTAVVLLARCRRFWQQGFERLDGYLLKVQAKRRAALLRLEEKTMNQATLEPVVRVTHAADVLTMTRRFGAPPEQVFDAWTRAEHFAQWFGPRNASMPHCRIDPRPGGLLHFFMRVPGDVDVWCKGVFQEVTRPSRLVFNWHFSNEAGEFVEREGFPLETVVTLTFSGQGGGTEMVLRQEGLVSDQGEIQGWKEGFERLDALLESID